MGPPPFRATPSGVRITVKSKINDIPAGNTAQPGVVLSGSVNAGGYLITDFTGANNDFVLLAETGNQLLGDEGGSGAIVKDLGAIPWAGPLWAQLQHLGHRRPLERTRHFPSPF